MPCANGQSDFRPPRQIIAPRDKTIRQIAMVKHSARHAGWCCTFPNDLTGIGLLHSAIAQVLEFSADEFYALAASSK